MNYQLAEHQSVELKCSLILTEVKQVSSSAFSLCRVIVVEFPLSWLQSDVVNTKQLYISPTMFCIELNRYIARQILLVNLAIYILYIQSCV